jgi:uncharacterized cupin superfamily protein
MEIIKQDQAISVRKPEGTSVVYYIFPEYELHYNEVEPGTVQQWHHHNVIEETIYIISGEIEAHWLEGGNKVVRLLNPGDVVRVENTPHTLINSSKSMVTFLVVRLILEGKDKREIIKSDKYLDQVD